MFRLNLFLVLTCFAGAAGLDRIFVQAETWTSLQGDKSIDASMVGLWDGHVILVLTSGQRISVPMSSLIARSRIQAERIAETLVRKREQLSTQLRETAAREAAPAPDPLPEPSATSRYETIASGGTAEDAMNAIQTQVGAGHFVVLHDALPPSFREELQRLYQLGLTKLDAEAFRSDVATFHGLGDFIVSHQNWFRSHPKLAEALPGEEQPSSLELFERLLLPIAGAVRKGFAEDSMSLQTMRRESLASWLHRRDAELSAYLAEPMREFTRAPADWSSADGGFDEIAGDPSETTGQQGEKTLQRGDITLTLKQVEGYWIPSDLAEGFQPWANRHREFLQSQADASMTLSDWFDGNVPQSGISVTSLLRIASGLQPTTQSLRDAKTPAAFHESLDATLDTISDAVKNVMALIGS